MKWLINLQFRVETGTFILHGTYTNPGAHPASYLVGTRVLSPAVNPKHVADLHLMLISRRKLYLIPASVCIALCWKVWIVLTCTEVFRLCGVNEVS